MEKSATELTNQYIKDHPDIRSCLKKGLINYSSLARLISKDLGVEKKTSNEAILIAARRFHERLKKEATRDAEIKGLLSKSEIEIKNKMVVVILERSLNLESLDGMRTRIRKESGTLYAQEGSDNYTVITQEKYAAEIKEMFRQKIIKVTVGLSLINFKSPKEIEQMCGVIAYLTSLFAENGVNIVEFLSCWTDTLFVIDSNDVGRVLEFLKF